MAPEAAFQGVPAGPGAVSHYPRSTSGLLQEDAGEMARQKDIPGWHASQGRPPPCPRAKSRGGSRGSRPGSPGRGPSQETGQFQIAMLPPPTESRTPERSLPLSSTKKLAPVQAGSRPQHQRQFPPGGAGRTQQIRRGRAHQGSVRQGAQGSARRLRQGSHRLHGPRPVLAALLLGTDSPGRPTRRGRPGPGMARRQADPAPARRDQRRHHQHRRIDRPRHRDPRRLSTTGTSTSTTRRDPTASTSAICPAAANSTSWPAPTSSPLRAPASATSSTKTGPTSTPRKADRIYAMSGGFDPTASSLELKQLFEERLRRPHGLARGDQFRLGRLLPVWQDRASSGSSSTPS